MATKENKTQQMQHSELSELHSQADEIQLRDHQMGQFLHQLIVHLGHAHGIDLSDELEPIDAPTTTYAEQQQEANSAPVPAYQTVEDAHTSGTAIVPLDDEASKTASDTISREEVEQGHTGKHASQKKEAK